MNVVLKNRGVIEISGDDAKDFLQGIITNDINKVSDKGAVYALMLSPQGKFLFDFFIIEADGKLLLDCEKSRIGDIIKRLNMYKLRLKLEIKDISDEYMVAALSSSSPDLLGNIIYPDPRNANMGFRAITSRETEVSEGNYGDYERLRIENCIPDPEKDMGYDKSLPLNFNMEELNAVDFRKGCYIGQEVTARMKHRGLVRKKLYKILSESDLSDNSPEEKKQIRLDDKLVGEVFSSHKNQAIAMFDIEIVEKIKSEKILPFIGDTPVKIL